MGLTTMRKIKCNVLEAMCQTIGPCMPRKSKRREGGREREGEGRGGERMHSSPCFFGFSLRARLGGMNFSKG